MERLDAMRVSRLTLSMSAAALLTTFFPATARAQCSLTNPTNWCVHQDSPDVNGGAEDDDRFGAALAFGDFNGDGLDDLAVGAPGENNDAGVVHVFYSNGSLLTVAGQQLFSQDSLPGGDEGAENGDEFGAALAAGDFDGDGFDDLAIGSPGEDLPEVLSSDCTFSECEDAGLIHVVYGGPPGLVLGSAEVATNRDVSDDLSLVEGGRFGATLTTAHLSGAGLYADLAIGAPKTLHGDAYITFGGEDGFNSNDLARRLNVDQNDCFHREFGSSFAAGRFDATNGTLVVGAPICSSSGTFDNPGEEGAFYLRSHGVLFQYWQTDFPSAGASKLDHFSAALAAGDFDDNGRDDVVASAPNKDHGPGNPSDSGRVYVAYSDADGPQPATAADIIGEDEWADVGDAPAEGEHFGNGLAAGDVDGDGIDDLLVGAPGEGAADVGRIYLKRGSATGLTTANHDLFTQTRLGGSNGDDDHLGNVIALGDINGDGVLEIALGVPDKDIGSGIGTANDAGMVYVTRAFNRRLVVDGFESGTKAAWSATTP